MVKKHIPNAITLLNLVFGCCALVSILYGQYVTGFGFIVAAVAADYADGLVARLLGVHSELGKELDSIADVVSFGVVPGAIYYQLLLIALEQEGTGALVYAAVPGFVLSAFSGMRLAKFNLDTRQTEGFIGLPTPSSTMFVTGLMLIYALDSYGMGEWVVRSPIVLYALIALQSYLLVSEIPMFALKFKSLTWAGNEIKFIFAGIALLLLILTQEVAFSAVVVLYVVFSAVRHFTKH
ncbi:MAG: CDP-alcohol phosphatidyltransferase family protein [Phaeodactylibacter sp.]|uniref:CDP-alcohol phosphatidyltransferase family protein n=1 Tax=Phaeodactylibacter sp. TaxID=1940289 RepID=UPI0032EBB2C0